MIQVKNNYIIEDNESHEGGFTPINVIMFTRLTLGLYSNISKKKIFIIIAKLYCICCAIFGTYHHVTIFNAGLPKNVAINSIQKLVLYDIIVLVSLFSNGENFYKYLNGLYKIDVASTFKIKKFVPLFSILIFLIIMAGIFFRIVLFPKAWWNSFTLFVMLDVILLVWGVYCSHMTRIMMFELLWNRMRVLRETIESQLDFSRNILDRAVKQHIVELEKYLNVYKMLLDNLKKVGHASKVLIFLSLPSYFLYVFTIVLEKLVLKSNQYEMDALYISDCMINVILPLVPALFAELVTAEVEKIRINLTRQLLFCSDDALRNRIEDALKFLELHPFKYTIWRVFSLNISLPLGLISLCTTYIIVIIQFTHVYD